MDEDGCSLLTFFNQCKETETSVLVVRDEDGHIFGGFCTEPWTQKFIFFGQASSFLFTFQDGDELEVFKYTGDGDQFMYSDDKSIGIGGSKNKGRFGLYMHNDFKKGSSCPTEIFNNKVLSSKSDFRITSLEVWGILE